MEVSASRQSSVLRLPRFARCCRSGFQSASSEKRLARISVISATCNASLLGLSDERKLLCFPSQYHFISEIFFHDFRRFHDFCFFIFLMLFLSQRFACTKTGFICFANVSFRFMIDASALIIVSISPITRLLLSAYADTCLPPLSLIYSASRHTGRFRA